MPEREIGRNSCGSGVEVADSISANTGRFSSARTTKHFLSSRCALSGISGVALASARREGPEDWNEHAGGNPENQVQWCTHLWEIGKAITARAEDVGVRLIANRRCKTGAAAKHHRDRKWPRVQAHRRRDFKGDRC